MKGFILFSFGVICLLFWAVAPASAQSNSAAEIDSRAWQYFSKETRDILQNGSVDINAPFLFEVEGEIGKDGKLNASTAKVTKKEGDVTLLSIAQSSIETFNDSGYLYYLSGIGINKVKITLAQDASEFTASVNSLAESKSRARMTESSIKLMLSVVKQQISRENSTEARIDDLKILDAVSLYRYKLNLEMAFRMDKAEFHKLVLKYLAA